MAPLARPPAQEQSTPPNASATAQIPPVNIPVVNILRVEVHKVDVAMMLDQIAAWVAAPSAPCRQICTVNPEFIVDANRDPVFATALRRADLRVPDGVGILWAAQLLGAPLPQRVTGSDGIYQICQRAAQAGWRVYFLGAGPGVAEAAAQRLSERYSGLQVAGCYAGSPEAGEWPTIAARLTAAQPDILFVAYGHPRQELWIYAYRQELPVKVALGIGGAMDFVTGVAQRAPQWMQRLGLEWL